MTIPTTMGAMVTTVRHIEECAIKPALAASCRSRELHAAQVAFIAKKHTGNIVVIP